MNKFITRGKCGMFTFFIAFLFFITGLCIGHYQQYQNQAFLNDYTDTASIEQIKELIKVNHRLTEEMKVLLESIK